MNRTRTEPYYGGGGREVLSAHSVCVCDIRLFFILFFRMQIVYQRRRRVLCNAVTEIDSHGRWGGRVPEYLKVTAASTNGKHSHTHTTAMEIPNVVVASESVGCKLPGKRAATVCSTSYYILHCCTRTNLQGARVGITSPRT